MSHLQPGTNLNNSRYQIKELIGQGGFGIIYLAERIGYYEKDGYGVEIYYPTKGETVAIKELYYKDYCQRSEHTGLINISNVEKQVEFDRLVNKLMEEGNTLRSLVHRNIIRTKDIFKENGTAYMVMDYVKSKTLKELVKSDKLKKEQALLYINQVLNAIEYTHGKKIVHLDINPSNILINEDTGEAVIIDFGASLVYDIKNKVQNTTAQIISGYTAGFAPFEQSDINNLKEFDATFDTYAIGATLYNLLTGLQPPRIGNIIAGRQTIQPASAENKEVSDYLDAIILKAMAQKYNERFESASEFKRKLAKEVEYAAGLISLKEKINQEINIVEKDFLPTKSLELLRPDSNVNRQVPKSRITILEPKPKKPDKVADTNITVKPGTENDAATQKEDLSSNKNDIPMGRKMLFTRIRNIAVIIFMLSVLIWWVVYNKSNGNVPATVSLDSTHKRADTGYANPKTSSVPLALDNKTLDTVKIFSEAGILRPPDEMIQRLMLLIKNAPREQQEKDYVKSFVVQCKQKGYQY